MNNKKHYAAAIAAFVGWGFFSIPLRALQRYPAGEILYFRILFSALIMLVIVFAFKRADWRNDWSALKALSKPERNNVILLTLAGGALLSVNWLLFIYRSEERRVGKEGRSLCDWSSDVCSSDLATQPVRFYTSGFCSRH